MNKPVILLLCLPLFFACKKNKGRDTAPAITDTSEMKYTVRGPANRDMKWTDTADMDVVMIYKGGKKQNISLSVTGLPAGIKSVFAPASGMVDFLTRLTFYTTDAAGGAYPVSIITTTDDGRSKTSSITLFVKGEPPRCDIPMAGTYYLNGHEVYIEPTAIKNVVLAKNYNAPSGEKDMLLSLNCETNTLNLGGVVPLPITSATYGGYGRFMQDTIFINTIYQPSNDPPSKGTDILLRKK